MKIHLNVGYTEFLEVRILIDFRKKLSQLLRIKSNSDKELGRTQTVKVKIDTDDHIQAK